MNIFGKFNYRKGKYCFFKSLEHFFKGVSLLSLLLLFISRTKNGGAVIMIIFIAACSLCRHWF